MKQLSLLPVESSTPPVRLLHPLYAERWPFITKASNFRCAEAEAVELARIKAAKRA